MLPIDNENGGRVVDALKERTLVEGQIGERTGEKKERRNENGQRI